MCNPSTRPDAIKNRVRILPAIWYRCNQIQGKNAISTRETDTVFSLRNRNVAESHERQFIKVPAALFSITPRENHSLCIRSRSVPDISRVFPWRTRERRVDGCTVSGGPCILRHPQMSCPAPLIHLPDETSRFYPNRSSCRARRRNPHRLRRWWKRERRRLRSEWGRKRHHRAHGALAPGLQLQPVARHDLRRGGSHGRTRQRPDRR